MSLVFELQKFEKNYHIKNKKFHTKKKKNYQKIING